MHLLPRMSVMLDFICMRLVELLGARNKRKFQNEKILSMVGFEPMIGSLSLRYGIETPILCRLGVGKRHKGINLSVLCQSISMYFFR